MQGYQVVTKAVESSFNFVDLSSTWGGFTFSVVPKLLLVYSCQSFQSGFREYSLV